MENIDEDEVNLKQLSDLLGSVAIGRLDRGQEFQSRIYEPRPIEMSVWNDDVEFEDEEEKESSFSRIRNQSKNKKKEIDYKKIAEDFMRVQKKKKWSAQPEFRTILPDVVTKHIGFFATLAQAGLKPVGMEISDRDFEPHQRRFNLLQDVTFMVGPGGNIKSFSVPQLGCEFLTTDMYKNMSYFDGQKVVGNSVDVCYGIREKLDG